MFASYLKTAFIVRLRIWKKTKKYVLIRETDYKEVYYLR